MSSSMSESRGVLGLKYVNKNCQYGKTVDIKVSNIRTNPNRLFYTCREK